jgi:hypothetical protein
VIDLEEIDRALAAATPGPWEASWCHASYGLGVNGIAHQVRIGIHAHTVANTDQITGVVERIGGGGRVTGEAHPVELHPDATLIANAPTWLAGLVAEVRRLRAREPINWDRVNIERADAAEREVRYWQNETALQRGLTDRTAAERDANEATIARLRAALVRYGRHDEDCYFRGSGLAPHSSIENRCTCGLTATLRGPGEE